MVSKSKEQRENETKTNRITILKTDEVMLYNKDKEMKQRITLKNNLVKVRITAFLIMYKRWTCSLKNIFKVFSVFRDNITFLLI